MQKNGLKKYVFIFFIFLSAFSFFSAGQNINSPKKDTSGIVSIRTSENIHTYLNDKSFLYDTEQAQAPLNLLQRILLWIQQLIFEFFYLLGKGGNLVSYIFYALVLSVLTFIILKLLGLSPHHILLRSKKIKFQNLPVFEEDINTVDFEKIIDEAIKNRNYRKAVRFLYIKFLKILSDNEEIEWKKEKTNKDYKHEMKNSAFFSDFSNLTKIYEHVWYGEFKIKQSFFMTVYEDFTRIFGNIK